MLDNSIFELGTAYDPVRFAEVIEELRPSEYIVPDVLEDSGATIDSFDKWQKTHGNDLPGTAIGVVQGKTYTDIKNCCKFMTERCDRIAMSFDYSYYRSITPPYDDEPPTKENDKWYRYAYGRCKTLQKLDEDMVLPYNKSYHLLGCALPQEYEWAGMFRYLKKRFWSLDTSNPVVHGLQGVRYNGVGGLEGLDSKESIKLADLINSKPNRKQMTDINYNIKAFRNIVANGAYG